MIENTRDYLIVIETALQLVQEREASGLGSPDRDVLGSAHRKAVQTQFRRKIPYRDALDALKVELGLSPSVSILPDMKEIAAFREVYNSVDEWQRHEDREWLKLIQIINELPEPGDIILDGERILDAIAANPDRWEEMVAKVYRLALEKRVASANRALAEEARIQLELETRRRVRNLVGIRRAYADAKRHYHAATRVMDQSFERLIRPAGVGHPSRSLYLDRFVQAAGDVAAIKDDFTELWMTFRTERLASIATSVCFPTATGSRSTQI